MSQGKIRNLLKDLQASSLGPEEDLKSYVNKILDINSQLSWAGQAMPKTFIVNMMLETLKSSRYKTQIKTILAAHSAAKIPIDTVDKLSTALEEDDIFDGKAQRVLEMILFSFDLKYVTHMKYDCLSFRWKRKNPFTWTGPRTYP